MQQAPIGIFDSGYGGLTVMQEIVKKLPEYDYIYLGDNARSPYGTRSYEIVYQYTLEAVKKLADLGCKLIVLACNTASAKALRTIQQNDLPKMQKDLRVLGVIRPTTEIIGNYSNTNHIGVFATNGTVDSNSYPIEIEKFFPDVKVFQQACPLWVSLIENNEYKNEGADFFIKKNIEDLMLQSNKIDTVLLGCTHYPLLLNKIKKYLDPSVNIISQGEIVANSLVNYLSRHSEIEQLCSKNKSRTFYTTDSPENFDLNASNFYNEKIKSNHLEY